MIVEIVLGVVGIGLLTWAGYGLNKWRLYKKRQHRLWEVAERVRIMIESDNNRDHIRREDIKRAQRRYIARELIGH